MSSDWKEPGPPWQDTPNANWTQSPDLIPPQHVEDDYPLHAQQEQYAYAPGIGNTLDSSFFPEEDVLPDKQEMNDEEESEIVANLDPVAMPTSLRQQVWQYVTLIVFPLLFFGISCLLVLPAVARNHPTFPPIAFWVIAIVLLLIAIGQGVAVYFSAPHHNMWILGTLGGFILFVLIGVFAVLGPLAGTLLLLAILIGCIYLARRCIHSVPEGSVDIVYVSGKYKRTLFAGLNLIWPWEKVAHQVNIEEINWNCPPQKVQLSPEEDLTLRAVISYQVVPEDAYLAVTQVKDWEESLRNLFVTTLQTISTHFEPTDFLPWPQSLQTYKAQTTNNPQSAHLPDEGVDDFSGGPARREHINTLLFQQMRDRVALWGVQIHWVRIRDIELAPHALAGMGTPPIMPDYTQTTDGDQIERELVGASSVIQSTDARGNANTGGSVLHIPVDPTPSKPLPPKKLPSEEVLKKVYEEVQNGKVTDPQTIRYYATIFEAVARDPEASEKVSFDADRAARNLYDQAQRNEEMYRSGMVYSDVTKPDMPMQ